MPTNVTPPTLKFNPQLLEFHVPFQHVGAVDKENGVVHGVSLITGGIKARGHDLEVDSTTLQQLFECATKMGQVPVKWNHKTGADAVNGYVTNFFLDGNNLRGDWHLLQTHSQFKQALELAERMPKNIGLSAAFVPPLKPAKGDAGKARCEELVSVDLVAQPAANPDGLFEAKVDRATNGKSMAEQNSSTEAAAPAAQPEPTLADLMALVKQQGEQIQQLTEGFQSLGQGDGEGELDLAQLADMTDEQLIAAGFDPAKVDAALTEAVQNGELQIEGEGEGDNAGNANAGNNANGAQAAAAAPGTVGAELSDLRREINHFKNKEKREILMSKKDEEDRMMHAFEVLEAKTVELAAQNDALRTALKTGAGSAVSAGSEIQLDARTGEPVTFEQIVNAKFVELMKKKDMAEAHAKSLAVDFGVRKHPAAYREFRSSGRDQIEFAAQPE